MHKRRVLLFGVDGLTFRVLNPMIERGLLPNFQKLCVEGAQSILQSSIPPVTPVGWMSIATSQLPAQHGIYDFWQFERVDHKPRVRILTHRRGGKAIWNVLSELGKRAHDVSS